MRQSLRFRYSIKTLLLTVFVVSVALTSILLLSESAREQADAVRELQRLGATVYYDFQRDVDTGSNIDPWKKPADWKWARQVVGDDYFSSVFVIEFVKYDHFYTKPWHTFGPRPTATELSLSADKYFHLLESIPNMTQLDLSYSHVSDAAIPNLAKLKALRVLLMRDSRVTQEGVERLRKLLPNCIIQWAPKEPVEVAL